MAKKMTSDQLEEGEIIDDGDDFEDISDNSIIDSSFGKLVSPYGHLRALSLSSGSESDRPLKHKRKVLHNKCKIGRHRRRKRIRHSSKSSDSDVSPPCELKGKLKEAIHVNGIEGAQRNTLEARLKAMGGLTIHPEPTTIPTPLPNISPKQNNVDDKVDDKELENLRLEALKTAVLNKHQQRKRKKALQEQETATPLETQENKENDTPKDKPSDINNGEKKIEANPVDDLDEDEDLLRASLLAGLAKNITKKQTQIENSLHVKQVALKLPTSVSSVLPKQPINKSKNIVTKKIINKRVINKRVINNKVIRKVNLPIQQVKPLIINVNSDSDSEEEIKQKTPSVVSHIVESSHQTVPKLLLLKSNAITQKLDSKVDKPNTVSVKVANIPPKVPDLTAISSNVEKFLKEQREKFEKESKSKLQTPKRILNKTALEKSAVKLLPKSQQMEYQLLLKKLRNAEKVKQAKKLALQNLKNNAIEKPKPSSVTVEVSQVGPNVEVTTTTQNTTSPIIEIIQPVLPIVGQDSFEKEEKVDDNISETSSYKDEILDRRRGITNELTLLQKSLKEMKTQKNGSLQIKSKYQNLTPIIRKITTTSNERKKQEHRIKGLLQELRDARNNLSKSHERFSNLVKELVAKKEKIDKSLQESKLKNGKIARESKNDEAEINVRDHTKETLALSATSASNYSHSNMSNEATGSSLTNHDCEDMDVCNSDETDICQIHIVDPNDIDQIFRRNPLVKSSIPEYVSPLNYNSYGRYPKGDPLGIMCPYEVNGSCRDDDCTYKHYLKKEERV